MRFYGFKTLLALSVVASTALSAQEALQLESVTVSANKIEEEIKNIPQSISVIDEVMVEERGIKNLADIANEIPNFNVSNFFANQSNFRGINPSIFSNNNPVTIYIDGVPQSSRYGYDVSLANVERIEVLRGPQGALYGKDSIGGVINIITKTPSNEWQGQIGAEYGSFNTISSTFNASGALIKDKLFLGLNGDYTKSDGWVENENPKLDKHADASKNHNLNLNATYKPTENLTAKLSISNGAKRHNWLGDLVPLAKFKDWKRNDAKKVNYETKTFTDTFSNSQALALDYEMERLRLSSVTTHKKVTLEGEYDADYGNNPMMDGLMQFQYLDTKTFTQELRLSSKESNAFRYIGGLYFEREKINNKWYGQQMPPSPMMPAPSEADAPSNTTSTTKAIFAQSMIPLGDRFELTLGGRYQVIDKEMISDTYFFPLGNRPATPMLHLDMEHKWNVFLPKAALSYKVNDNWTSYATISKGYLPGGFNFFPMMPGDQNRFEPQTSINYELGFHAQTLGNRLRLSGALFYMDIKDVHVFSIDPNNHNNFITDNADGATSKGIELEALYRATERIDLNAALGIINAKYKEYKSTFGTDNKGNKIENTPSFNLKLGITYTDPSGFYARGDVKMQGKTYYSPTNTLYDEAYTVVDTKLGYRFGDWDIYAYGKNITNTDYVAFMQDRESYGNAYTLMGKGREFGIGGRYFF